MTGFMASIDLTSVVVAASAVYVMVCIEDYCTRVCRILRGGTK